MYYKTYGCNTCHRIGNDGGGVVGPDLIGPDLTFIGFRKNRQWLDLWLKNPAEWKPDTIMQNFFLDENTRKKLVDYLVLLKGEGYQKNPPWNKKVFLENPVMRGREIYERTGCTGCHGKDGAKGVANYNAQGGRVPALTYVKEGFTADELKKKIRSGVQPVDKEDLKGPVPPLWMQKWGERITDEELDDLVEYLFSLMPEEEKWTE